MLLPEAEEFPDLAATTLDQILTVRVVMDPEGDGFLMKDAATVESNQATDCSFDLQQPHARAVLDRQMKKQMAMLDVRLPPCLALSRPCSGERNTAAVQPLVQTFTEPRVESAVRIVTNVGEAPVNREMG